MQRLFSSSARSLAHKSKRDIAVEEGTKWLSGPGRIYDNLAPRNWLHPSRPFPKNPWFVPNSPVGDEMRSEIYTKYLSDPMKWTPRQLALEFKLSVIRIEAILRLKHLERVQQKQGYVLQEKFSREMEKLLDAGSAKHRIVEPADLPSQQQSSASQESSPSSPSDPKDMFKRRSDGNYVFSLSGVIGEPEEPVKILEERNPRETNERWKFIVADLSSPPEKRRMYVRDNDGTLRTATKMEKEMHESLYPLTPNEKKSKTEGAQKLWQI